LEPAIVWEYTRNNTLKKENFDMTDAYACVLAVLNRDKIEKEMPMIGKMK
jgi:hypothetical protein